jgi:hypothetical protein
MHTAKVYDGLVQILNRSCDLKPSKTMSNWLLEPPNPFDPKQRRSVRPELLILLTYLFLMGAVFAVFNLW